jgi:hypothetical protein
MAHEDILQFKKAKTMFYVEKIDYERLQELINIWIERQKWLEEKHNGMWNIDELNKECIIQKYENPSCYMSFDKKEPIGGFLLLERDSRYWPDNTEDKAFYIHKFVIGKKYGGKGYSEKMLIWIKNLGSIKNKEYIRLDYDMKREYLRSMYLKNGFRDIELKLIDGFQIMKAEYQIRSQFMIG